LKRDVSGLLFYFQRECTPLTEKRWKRRSHKLKFAVGMVVVHKHRGNQRNEAGVIIGWHNRFQPEWFSFCPCRSNFERNMRNHLQPYYIILMDDDIMCYVPQSMNIKLNVSLYLYII